MRAPVGWRFPGRARRARVRGPSPASCGCAAALLCVLLLSPATRIAAQPPVYGIDPSWPQLPVQWGQVVATDVDADGNVYVLHRCGADSCLGRDAPPLLKFSAAGELLAAWGATMFVWPHGLHVDRDGFVWATDARGAEGRGHQVFKFAPDGELLMTLGTAGVAGTDETTFDGPTDVAVASNGDIFVADGHGNARVVRFSADGRFLRAWGRPGSGPGEFNVPHAIAISAGGRVLVGDRDNARIQVFDVEGRFVDEWTQFGAPSGFFVGPDDMLYVAHALGVRAGSARDGRVLISVEHTVVGAEAGNIEDVAADAAGNLYAGLAEPRVLRRLQRR